MGRKKEAIAIYPDRIRNLLKEKNLKQVELAEMINYNKDSLNQALRKGEMVRPLINDISIALRVNPYYLTGESDDPSMEAYKNRKEAEVLTEYWLEKTHGREAIWDYYTDLEYGYFGFKFDFHKLNEYQKFKLEEQLFETIYHFLKDEQLLPDISEEAYEEGE